MAIPVENVFTIDFDDRYKLAYQGMVNYVIQLELKLTL